MTLRYALYARYSSDNQSEASIEDQLRLCREKVASKGGTVVDEYADYAISGASTNNRPQLQNLLADANLRKFDLVVAEDLSRISRDQEDIAGIYKKLSFLGIKLITLSEGEINELHIGLKGTMNAIYLKDLADKTRRGQRGCVEEGKIPGGITYGYKKVVELDEKGEPVRGKRSIDPDQRKIVERIFTEYADGFSAKTIAKNLNAEGIPAPRGGQWNASTINGSRQRRNGILHNELYIGFIAYNRQSFRKDPVTGRRLGFPNPECEWIVKEVSNLRIVSDDLWDQVQAIKAKNHNLQVSKRRRPARLLSGIVSCGECGGGYTVVGKNRMGCSAHREKGTCTNNKTISTDKLERRVLEGLKKHLSHPDMLAEYIKTYHATLKRLQNESKSRQTATEREISELTNKIAHIVDAIADGYATKEMKEKMMDMSRRKEQLEQELEGTDDTNVVEMHPNLPEQYQRRIQALQDALNREESRQKAANILRSLIDKVVLIPGEGRGKLDIELHGDIAALLHLLQQKGDTSSHVMKWLVAGAGFEPATFRL